MKFNDSEERDSFIVRLKSYFQSSGVAYIESEVSYSQLMAQATTKEMRDEILQRFFRTALAAVSHSNYKLLRMVIYVQSSAFFQPLSIFSAVLLVTNEKEQQKLNAVDRTTI